MTNAGKKRFVVGFTLDTADLSSLHLAEAIDPICIVTCFGNRYETEKKLRRTGRVKFDERFVWGDIMATEEEFAMATIKFKLEAANSFWRNDDLGTASVQLAMVRQRPNHTFQNTVQLLKDSEWTAKLEVSVYCYGEGEKPPGPITEEQDEDQFDDRLVPASIRGVKGQGKGKGNGDHQAYHLFVHVHRAEELGGGKETYNPYVTVEFNNVKLASVVAKNTNSAAFDQCFKLPVQLPLFVDAIVVRVWDKGAWGRDELIVQGRMSFSLLRT